MEEKVWAALGVPEKVGKELGEYIVEHSFLKKKEEMVEFVIANRGKVERHRERILGCSQVADVQAYFKAQFRPNQLTKCDPQYSKWCGKKHVSPHLLTPQMQPACTCGC